MKENVVLKIKQLFLQKDSLTICILTGVLLLVIAWPTKETKENKENKESTVGEIVYEQETDSKGDYLQQKEKSLDIQTQEQELLILEQKLEEFLTVMEGVGKVKVMITLDSLGEKVLEKDIPVERNVVTEQDAEGGSRNTNNTNSKEATVYITDEKGNKYPYVVTETLPRIKGVTVVCQGGESDLIQKNITEVIQALFGIEIHKIKIVKMKQME